MKLNKNLGKLTSLKIDSDGKLTGGFASLNSSQMNKIKGGIAPADSNGYCTNTSSCTVVLNEQCTNTVSC